MNARNIFIAAAFAFCVVPALALPPGGGGIPDPAPKPAPVYKADLFLYDLFKNGEREAMVTVKNKGNAASQPCDLRTKVYSYDWGKHAWVVIQTLHTYVPSIPAGKFRSVFVTTGPSLFQPGLYFQFTVDTYNAVDEWDEANNTDGFQTD